MFPFSRDPKDTPPEEGAAAPKPAAEAHPLDALTGGVFSAATSGERAQRVRDWLATEPTPEQMQDVYKDLAAKDKGAARALREKLDDLRRAKGQEAVGAEWAAKAEALIAGTRLNIADALAWQRDAAKAGAPLSREPLAGLSARLRERMKALEDLQLRVMVQREAAVMLSQRIELLSTKPWAEALAAREALQGDVTRWREQAGHLMTDAQWPSVDPRYASQLESAQTQGLAVWDAFSAALAQTEAAAQDAAAPLPPVPVWADELRAARGQPAPEAGAPTADKPAKPKIDPEQRAAATKAVEAGTMLLEQAVAAGHTKNMHSATQALRQSLKSHGRLIDDALEARVHAALVSAGELEGWQRWSADKVREQLVARAEALLVKRKVKGGAAATDASATAQNAEANAATTVTEEAGALEHAQAKAAAETGATDQDAVPTPASNVAEAADAAATEANAQANEPTAITEQAGAAEDAAAATPADVTTAPESVAEQQESTPTPAPKDAERKARTAAPADEEGVELVPAVGGRKLQETIRKLREEWKAADQGGPPNHQLWKRFDRAVNAAHKFVDQWIDKVRAESAEARAQREGLIEEVRAWGQAQAEAGRADWKAFGRQIHQFSERWRNAGHLGEKAFAELQPKWKEAIHQAAAPLEAAQKASTERRHAMIAEAEALGAAPQLRIDAVKSLQQRWQAEAQAVPLDRKFEQRLWDNFRKPIDDAFNRKGAERERQQAAMSVHDQAVLQAAKALEAANASGDAQRIRAAMAALEAATRGQAAAAEQKPAQVGDASVPAASETVATDAAPADSAAPTGDAPAPSDDAAADAPPAESAEGSAPAEGDGESAAAPAPAPAAPPKPAKPLVAMRGDDRPGMKKAEPAAAGRGGKFGDRGRPGAGGRDARGGPGGPGGDRGGRFGDRGPRDGGGRFGGDRFPPREDRGPRLGDAAFRAQRNAVEQAQETLRKLAAQAHGEALTQLLAAWQDRQPDRVPSVQDLGRAVTPAVRGAWSQAVGTASGAADSARQALLRLEMAAEVPTPAEHLDARRALQLQLLTRRNDPAPAQTWGQDAAAVLSAPYDEATARRLQNALKGLLRR